MKYEWQRGETTRPLRKERKLLGRDTKGGTGGSSKPFVRRRSKTGWGQERGGDERDANSPQKAKYYDTI